MFNSTFPEPNLPIARKSLKGAEVVPLLGWHWEISLLAWFLGFFGIFPSLSFPRQLLALAITSVQEGQCRAFVSPCVLEQVPSLAGQAVGPGAAVLGSGG